MPELSELFEQARGLNLNLDDEKVRESAFDALKKTWNPFYTALTNLGFGAAQSRLQKDLDTERQARERAETALRETQQKLTDKQTPEIKQLNEQWQAKLDQETGKLRTELEAEKAKTLTSWHDRDDAFLEALLVERKVPPTVAAILSRDPEGRKRRDYDDKGSLTVHQAGQRIPLSPGSGQTHLSLLADELVARPDIKAILISDGDAGGGITDGRSSGPASGDKAYYDNIRKQAEAERKAEAPRVPLKERVKNR